MPYEGCLNKLHLEKLTVRRLCTDLMTAYKALHGFLSIEAASIGVALSTAPTRGGGTDLVVHRAINNITRKTFMFRVSKCWNELPFPAKSAQSMRVFNNYLSKSIV